MVDLGTKPSFVLIYVIVNYGIGSRVLQKAKQSGISGGTIFLGKGTIHNSISQFLSLYEVRKEIILLESDQNTAAHVLPELNKEFKFEKPHHGIVFCTSTQDVFGSRYKPSEGIEEKRDEIKPMYHLIFTIVDKGKAEDVIEAATEAGSKGGTIINARGSGAHETSKLFYMDIEPEKEVVMILSKEDVTESIVSSIRKKLEIDLPGHGILFVQNVTQTYGIYE